MVSNRGPSAYQPNTLPLGQTSSPLCMIITSYIYTISWSSFRVIGASWGAFFRPSQVRAFENTWLNMWCFTGPSNVVVSTSEYGSEGHMLESISMRFFSSDQLLPRVCSAVGPLGRLRPHSWASSTSWMHLWGCCSKIENLKQGWLLVF